MQRQTLFLAALVIMTFAALPGNSSAQQFPKLDSSWTVTVNGQSVQVNNDGSFVIPNVSAADQFGPGGPGTAPDFVSDNTLRVIGVSTADGVTRYAYSDAFQFVAGQEFSVGQMTITDVPPPFPQSIEATPDDIVLTASGQATVVRVDGELIDGSIIDVTGAVAGTTYLTSNPGILEVDSFGVATAISDGPAFVTAINEGAASVVLIQVVLGDPLTEVRGFVQLEDGTSVVGADVTIGGQGQTALSLADGSFVIPNVATQLGLLNVTASAVIGTESFAGSSGSVEPVPGLLTDVGLITMSEFTAVTITFDAGSGSPPSYTESGLTVVSGQDHLHLGDNSLDGSPDLYNHSGCCSTPYEFTFGGAPFGVVSLDIVNLPSGTHTFTSSSGAVEIVAGPGVHVFSASGWTGITSFRWDATGNMMIDDLVIEAE